MIYHEITNMVVISANGAAGLLLFSPEYIQAGWDAEAFIENVPRSYWAAPAYRMRPICIPLLNRKCSQICGMTCGLRIIVVVAVVITPDRCVGSLEIAASFMCALCIMRYQYRLL